MPNVRGRDRRIRRQEELDYLHVRFQCRELFGSGGDISPNYCQRWFRQWLDCFDACDFPVSDGYTVIFGRVPCVKCKPADLN